MKKNILIGITWSLFLANLSSDIYAQTKKIELNIFRTIFDSLSIEEINKQKQQQQIADNETEQTTNQTTSKPKRKPQKPRELKETNITRYFKSWVLTGNIGQLWENAGETQTVNLAPQITKTYAANNNTQSTTEVALFWGVQKPLYDKLVGQIGVTLATIADVTLSGEIWDDANPAFNNLSYRYSLKTTKIAAKGIILFDNDFIIIPWISGSIGTSYNYSLNFLNKPLIDEVIVNPNFKKYTTQSLTYSFGAGVQKYISKHLQIGIGYEFTDWGRSRLSKSLFQTTFNAIEMQHFYTNGILVNLSYLA